MDPVDNRFNFAAREFNDIEAMFRKRLMTPLELRAAADQRNPRNSVDELPIGGSDQTEFVPLTHDGIDIPPEDVTAARTVDLEAEDSQDLTLQPDGSEAESEASPNSAESTTSGRTTRLLTIAIKHQLDDLRTA